MKTLLLILTLVTSSMAFAIDDLQSISLRIEESKTPTYPIHYPGYRINGGRPALIKDCFILDVMDSDNVVTMKQKMDFAKKISVRDGFGISIDRIGAELKPRVQGKSVVFDLISVGSYVTHIQARAKEDKTLLNVIEETLLPSEDPTSPIQVNLLYVRGCRL